MLDITKKRLNDAFDDTDLSNEEIAKRIHTNRNTLKNYKMGRTDMSSERLRDICSEFALSADYLLGLSDEDMAPLAGLNKEQKKEVRNYIADALKVNKFAAKK